MSHLQAAPKGQPAPWHQAIESSKDKFSGSGLDFKQEQIFATQLMMNNSYLMNVAKKNPTSLRLAMYNVAAVGLTLNPQQGLAYLVPRRLNRNEDPRVMLDISYRGLIAIGVETGAIRWSKSELVYEEDQFTYRGPAIMPDHQCDPFYTDRGAVRGGYCIAELSSGGVLVEAMSKADMDKARDVSEAFKKGFGPWVDWADQMMLKSIVKRASKWWPVTTPRMAQALKILNVDNGEGFAALANETVSPAALPAPPPRDEVPLDVQNTVKRLVDRAVKQNAYEACKDVMETRIKRPEELAFAFDELAQAKAKALANVQDSDTGAQVANS